MCLRQARVTERQLTRARALCLPLPGQNPRLDRSFLHPFICSIIHYRSIHFGTCIRQRSLISETYRDQLMLKSQVKFLQLKAILHCNNALSRRKNSFNIVFLHTCKKMCVATAEPCIIYLFFYHPPKFQGIKLKIRLSAHLFKRKTTWESGSSQCGSQNNRARQCRRAAKVMVR